MRNKIRRMLKRIRIEDGRKFRLKDFDSAKIRLKQGKASQALLEDGIKRLSTLQQRLYADGRWALLLIIQGMDAAGKDSVIKHLMSGVNPQGCEVVNFSAPSEVDLKHDFLWRSSVSLPERGRIGIFNRSYYEEILIVRVHREMLEREKLPRKLVTRKIWKERIEDINAYERHLIRNGVVIRKFFLNVSKQEQRHRFAERLREAAKNWKISLSDIAEREYWNKYMDAYEEMIAATASRRAPWFVVPADEKWLAQVAVAETIVSALEEINPQFPRINKQKRAELKKIRHRLHRDNRS